MWWGDASLQWNQLDLNEWNHVHSAMEMNRFQDQHMKAKKANTFLIVHFCSINIYGDECINKSCMQILLGWSNSWILDGRICTLIQKRKPLNIFILKWEFSLHNFRSCIIYAALMFLKLLIYTHKVVSAQPFGVISLG